MLDLRDTSSLVTGGASGLGEAAARLLAERGAKVLVADLNDDRRKAVAAGPGGAYVHADVTDTEHVVAAVAAAEQLGPLRTCVTAAGIGWGGRPVGKEREVSSAHHLGAFQKVLAVNLVGTFNTVRLAATAIARTAPVDEAGERG